MADDDRVPAPDEGPDSTAHESREAARHDDYETAQAQVHAAEEAHDKGDPVAGDVEEWPDSGAEPNPVAPGDDIDRFHPREDRR